MQHGTGAGIPTPGDIGKIPANMEQKYHIFLPPKTSKTVMKLRIMMQESMNYIVLAKDYQYNSSGHWTQCRAGICQSLVRKRI